MGVLKRIAFCEVKDYSDEIKKSDDLNGEGRKFKSFNYSSSTQK